MKIKVGMKGAGMKNFRMSGWVLPMMVMALVAFPLHSSHAVAVLELTDGSTTVSVTDGGVGDSNPLAGAITYSGSFGNWIANVATGFTKPLFPSDKPHLDLNSVNLSSGGSSASTLTITFSDTGFVPGSNWNGFDSLIGGTTSGTVNFLSDFNDGSDQALASLGFGSGAFSGSDYSGSTPTGTFSLREVVNIIHGAGIQSTSFNAEVFAAPETGALFLFGSGLIGLVGYRRVRRMQ